MNTRFTWPRLGRSVTPLVTLAAWFAAVPAFGGTPREWRVESRDRRGQHARGLTHAIVQGNAAGTLRQKTWPVVWTRSLELRSQGDVERRLAEPAPDTAEYVVWNARCSRAGGQNRCVPVDTIVTRSCREFSDALKQGLSGQTTVDRDAIAAVGVRCAAIRAIGTARAAKASAVRTFRLTRRALGELPATLALAVTDQDSVQLWAAGSRGVSLLGETGRASATVEHYASGDTALRVAARDQNLTFEILARGDFDGDGWDDLLVHAVAGARGGSFTTDEVYVLTRRDPGRVLRVVRRVW